MTIAAVGNDFNWLVANKTATGCASQPASGFPAFGGGVADASVQHRGARFDKLLEGNLCLQHFCHDLF